MFFGAKIDSLNDNLFINAFNKLIRMFPKITLEEIQESYSSQDIKKPFGLLTRDELLQPILDYQKLKHVAIKQLQEVEEELKEDEKFSRGDDKHKKESIEIYRESLKKGEWLGTPMQAHTLRTNKIVDWSFIENDKEYQLKIRKEADKNYNKYKRDPSITVKLPITPDYFRSELVVIECLKRKELIIVND